MKKPLSPAKKCKVFSKLPLKNRSVAEHAGVTISAQVEMINSTSKEALFSSTFSSKYRYPGHTAETAFRESCKNNALGKACHGNEATSMPGDNKMEPPGKLIRYDLAP